MMGENVSSARLVMTKLGGANDTVLHAGRNNTMCQYMLGASCLKSSCPEGHLGQTRLRVPWAALDKVLSAGQGR